MTRISALTALTSADAADTLPILDDSATTTKKITKTAFISDIVDGTLIEDDAVLARHIDWASTGADGGIWWEELGRTTLGSAGDTISITPIAARKFLKVIFHTVSTGGTQAPNVRFNNDSATNYAFLYANNMGAGAALTSQTAISMTSSVSQGTQFGQYEITNFTSQRKLVQGRTLDDNNASAASSCNSIEVTGKWDNVAAQITRIDLINSGAGDFAIGSVMTVLGHD